MGTVSDDMLSEAVTVYVWGSPPRSWPSWNRDAVARLFGDQAQYLLFRIDELLAEVDQMRPNDDLAVFASRIEQSLQSSHPELSTEARNALAGLFTYAWR